MTIKSQTGNPVYVIGVTGGIGSGKSAVGTMLSQMGVTVFDTDHIARDLRDKPGPVQEQILARFGADLLNSDGSINREKLGRIVFDDPQARKDLEDILHPAIAAVKQERIEASEGIVAVLVPLLYETSSQSQYDEVWTVVVQPDVQLARLRARDKRSDEELKKRIAAQLPQDAKAALSLVVIDNSGDLAATQVQVAQAIAETRERFAAKVALPAAAPNDGAAASPQPADAPAVDAVDTSNAGSVDGAEAAAATETDKAPPVPAGADGKENHYQGVLRDFGYMATEEALAKLGQVARTAGKEANASMSMVVSARDTGGNDAETTASAATPAAGTGNKPAHKPADQERELRVDVKMSVRNRPGQVDTPNPGDGSGNCGNGGTPNGHGHGHGRFLGTPMVLGLFGLLAFLAFVLALLFWFDRSHTAAAPSPTQVTVNPPNVTVTVEAPQVTVNNPPVVVVDGSGCVRCPVNPVEVQPLPVKPVTPPVVTPPVVVDPCQDVKNPDYLSEPPAFALRYIHNEVRWAVAQWTVGKSCTGTIVEGRDKEGRLVVRQVYRSYLAFVGQETFKYLPDGRIQVDRFDSNNIYVGRTYR
ncbi:MAG: dephospho-CoA kinase [Candidatus Obscuribacter sp.]|nr:dephospho-CoA kinase [Candidatus Obscuribacter sp.]